MYALFAPVDVKAQCVAEFVAASERNAKASLAEPGCVRFELHHDRALPVRFYFYEVYVDEAGFKAHERSAHYADWVEATQAMIEAEGQMIEMTGVCVRGEIA